jgi:hypothetical protein
MKGLAIMNLHNRAIFKGHSEKFVQDMKDAGLNNGEDFVVLVQPSNYLWVHCSKHGMVPAISDLRVDGHPSSCCGLYGSWTEYRCPCGKVCKSENGLMQHALRIHGKRFWEVAAQ